MATITLNYDARNTSIKKAFKLFFTLGVKIEKEYDPDFVSKITKADLEKSKKKVNNLVEYKENSNFAEN